MESAGAFLTPVACSRGNLFNYFGKISFGLFYAWHRIESVKNKIV